MSNVDLSRYILRRVDATCGHCRRRVWLLRPRAMLTGPDFWLCPRCGTITGTGGLVAPPVNDDEAPVPYRGRI